MENEQPDRPPPPATQEARDAEAAAIRRRWITLGEALAVIAVIISALTLWNSWSERSADEASKSAEVREAATQASRLVLTASTAKNSLVLAPTTSSQVIQEQTLTFPTALATAPVKTTGEPRIEADWFARSLIRARETRGLPDDSRGDESLPVLIKTGFVVDGELRTDLALYDVGYTVTGKWIGGHAVTLRGLARVAAVRAQDAQAKLDARWRHLSPGAKPR